MIFLTITLLIISYLIPLMLICIDRYRFFNGNKIKDYFNEDYYGYSLYSDDFITTISFIPFLNILFLIWRIIYCIFEIIVWVFKKIGVVKWFYRLININIK